MPHECTTCGRAFEDGSKEMLSGCPDCGGTTFQFRPEGTSVSTDSPDPPDPEVDGVARTVGNAASAVRELVTGDESAARADPSGSAVEPTSDGDSTDATSARETDPSTTDPDEVDSEPDGRADETDDAASTDESGDAGQQATATPEDSAQSDARTDIVEADEVPDSPGGDTDRPPVPDPRPLSARSDADGDADDETDPDHTVDPDATDPEDPEEGPSLAALREELNSQFESIRVVAPGRYELNLMELYDREEYIVALRQDGKYSIQLPERWDDR